MMDLRSTLVLLCFCGLSVSEHVLLLPPGPLQFRVGDTATFTTLLKNPEFLAIAWNFEKAEGPTSVATLTATEENVNDPYIGRATIDANGTLTLTKLTVEDSGEYILSLIDTHAENHIGRINLQVMVPVSEVKIESHTVIIGEAHVVTLNCTAKGTFLNYKWVNVSTPITGDGQRITMDQDEISGTLTFSPLNRYDLAKPTYCEASNSISRDRSSNMTLIMPYGPESVTISPKAPPAFVASQSDFSMNCSSESHPEATYAWFHEDTQLTTTGPTLTVQDIEKQGLGKTRASYTCKATNSKTGKTVPSMSVAFTIIESISGITLTSPVGKLFAGNGSASLNCSATKGSMQTVKWLKNGAALSSDGRVVILANATSVMIKPVQKEDNAEYTCQISNPVSKQEEKVKLTVYYGPEPVVLTGASAVEVTDPVKLECSAPSLPPATYTWKFNGTKTMETTNQYVINQAEFSHAGTYTCEAYNSETKKTSRKDIFLSVKEEGALSEGLSGGAIAGIVIGVLAAIGLAVGLFLYFRQKGEYSTPKDQNTA